MQYNLKTRPRLRLELNAISLLCRTHGFQMDIIQFVNMYLRNYSSSSIQYNDNIMISIIGIMLFEICVSVNKLIPSNVN